MLIAFSTLNYNIFYCLVLYVTGISYLQRNQVTNLHVSLKDSHGTQLYSLDNNGWLSILTSPWILGEVMESKILKRAIRDGVSHRRSNMVNNVSIRFIRMSHHCCYHSIHHHVCWNLLANRYCIRILNIERAFNQVI